MAVGSFDEILSSLVSDENDKSVLSDLATRYPEIKNGWLRQSDYSKKLDSFRDTEKELKGKVDEWDQWAAKNWDFDIQRPKMEAFWQAKAEELEKKVGTEVTFDEIKAYTEKTLTDKGVVTKTDFESILKEKSEQVDKGFQGSAYFNTVLTELAGEHLAEFKKPLKTRDFISKLKELGTDNLDDAYSKYVAADREANQKLVHEKEIEKIREAEYKKAKEEIMAKLPTGGVPVDQGSQTLGPLQAKLQHVSDPDAAAKAVLGDGTTARLAAEAYRKEKMGATQ